MIDLSVLIEALPGIRVRRKSLMVSPHTKQFEHYEGFVISVSLTYPCPINDYQSRRAIDLFIQFDNWIEMGRPDGEGARITHDPFAEYQYFVDGVWINHEDLSEMTKER